jgi:eukaryotic-like serine/threonine-protein kinase
VTLEFDGTSRFEVIRALGRGGSGAVYAAFDRKLGVNCALKLLPRVTPRRLVKFKHEFRVLQGLSHPNLLRLGELLNEGDHWFFTMELVDGADFLTYVRRGHESTAPQQVATLTLDDSAPVQRAPAMTRDDHWRVDDTKLRAALAQLAEALRFLHDAGKVHRDVKPSNVLVTAAGRVVVLDFGLVANLAELEGSSAGTSGTPGYMAPEQTLGRLVGAPADLYAMGIVLFHALTGTLPPAFPTRPSSLVPNVSRALDDLCLALLAPDPAARPSARDVLTQLGAVEPPERPEPNTTFVGRSRELQHILTAYDDSRRHPVIVVLEGPSGIGKSALLDELRAQLVRRPERPLILSGRCYEHEGIPYKAIDGVMDELGDALAGDAEPLMPALPANVSLLSILFPALGRVPAFAHRTLPTLADAYETRRAAEHGGRALFTSLAVRGPVVIVIDDFQWSDPDSVSFLAALTAPPAAPPFLLLVSSRMPGTLPLGEDVRSIALPPLPLEDARELAARLISSTRRSTTSADEIAEEAAGHPFFMTQLVWRAADRVGQQARLEDLLWERINACDGPARVVLELVAVAAVPIAQEVIAEAAQLDAGAFTRALQDLRTERLVRTTGIQPHDDVEAYHDRIRDTVVSRLSDTARAGEHLRLAKVLERLRPDDFDSLVTHFEGGGDREHAAAYAVHAGDQAARALAFERAAAFYRRAIAGLPAQRTQDDNLRVRLADALAHAGLGGEAALEYERAAAHATPAQSLELRRRAAENLLRSGRLEDGSRLLSALLERQHVRVPRTPITAFTSLLLQRARLRLRGLGYRERRAADLEEADLLRVDTLWVAAARLGPTDPIRAAELQARHLFHSLEIGEPFRLARALLAEATFASMGGPRQEERVERLLTCARPLVGKATNPYAKAMLTFTEGLRDLQFGRYARALAGLSRAAELLAATCIDASHDAAVTNRFVLDSLYNLGELGEMSRRLPGWLRDAERRGDLYLAAEMRTGLPNAVWLCNDQPDEARHSNERGIAPWSHRRFYLQHYYHALAKVQILLYLDEGAEAFRVAEQTWGQLRTSLLLNIQAVRAEALFLRARAAIAEGGRQALGLAEKVATRLAAEAIPAAPGLAAAARAGVAARRGDRATAIEQLHTAERALTAAAMGMAAAACRHHLGRTEAEVWMRERSVVRPDRFANLLVPGFSS